MMIERQNLFLGCVDEQLDFNLLEMTGDNWSHLIVCHHKRANYYYLESLIPPNVVVKIVEKRPREFVIKWAKGWEMTFRYVGEAVRGK